MRRHFVSHQIRYLLSWSDPTQDQQSRNFVIEPKLNIRFHIVANHANLIRRLDSLVLSYKLIREGARLAHKDRFDPRCYLDRFRLAAASRGDHCVHGVSVRVGRYKLSASLDIARRNTQFAIAKMSIDSREHDTDFRITLKLLKLGVVH